MGKLVAIAKRSQKKGPMCLLEKASVSQDGGVNDSYGDKPDKRKVTILRSESWSEVCAEVDNIDWIFRRANLLTEGLEHCDPGTRISIGEVVLEVTGETKPCSRMDEIRPGLQEVLAPSCRGGMTCKVIQPGLIEPGNDIKVLDSIDN